MRPLLMIALLLLVAGGSAPVWAIDDVRTHDLDNGMRIVVAENDRAPVIAHQVWYRVGSVDEYRGMTGVSHTLEHMMFKGTKNLDSGEFSRKVARHGGRENAFTSRDYTGYHQEIAADRLAMLIELEAERMQNLKLRPEEFEQELRVVQEERRQRVDDQPNSLLWERLRAAAFPSSPLGQPIIGWESDLEAMTVDDLEQWYERWYGPNNAVLTVVGAVDAERVFDLAEEHFGDIERIDTGRRLPLAEIESRGEQRVKVHAPAEVPYVGLAWRAPSLATLDDPADAWALRVLADVLAGSRSARIDRRVIRDQEIASSAGASYSPFGRGPTLFSVGGTPAGDHDAAALEEALRGEVERLKDGEIGAEELERVRTRTRASQVFALDSVAGQARRLAMLETLGLGHEMWQQYLDGIAAVDAEDIRRVAEEYLTDERLTVGTLVPDGIAQPGAQQGAPVGGEDHVDQ